MKRRTNGIKAKGKTVMEIAVAMFLLAVLVFGNGTLLAFADEYDTTFQDGDWTSGAHDYGGSLLGYSDSDHITATGKLKFACRCELLGEYWAWAKVYKDFTYTGLSQLNNFEIKYHRKGSAIWAGATCRAYIRVELEDLTDPEWEYPIHYGDNKDLGASNPVWQPDAYKTVTFKAFLQHGHTYRVTLRGRGDVGADLPGYIGSVVDFLADDYSRRVDWIHLKICRTEINPVPTLTQWGLIILTILVLGSGIWFMLKKRRVKTL